MAIDNDFEMNHNKREDKNFLTSAIWFMIFVTPLSWIIGWSMYKVLLFKRREKPSVAYLFGAIVAALAIIIGMATNALSKFLSVFTDLPSFLDNWTDLIPFILVLSVVIGVIEGLILITYEAYYMKRNKGNVHDISSWKYEFEYEPTPWAKAAKKKKIEDLKNGKLSDNERAALGIDVKNSIIDNENGTAYMYIREAARQTAIFGATGSGKTITQLTMAYNDIRFGRSTLVIDFKNSPQLASKLATWTKEAGGTFYHFVSGPKEEYDITNSPGQSTYDPLATSSVEASAEIILAMREWDVASSVYKTAKGQLTQNLLNMLAACDKKKAKGIVFNQGKLYMLATTTNKVALSNLVDACEGTRMQDTADTLWQAINTRGSNPLGAYNELAGDMTTLFNSKAGEWLKTSPDKPQLNLFKVMETSGNTILFSFSSDTEGEYSKLMGSLLFGDLNAVSAARRGAAMGDNTLSVYVDEFQVIPPSAFISLLEKGRESGVAMTIASQSIEQVVAAAGANGDAVKKSLLDTCSNFIIHAGTNYETAEDFSALVGKEDKLIYTTESSNRTGPFRELLNRHDRPNARASTQKDWKLDPSDFQDLSIPTADNGFKQEAILINKVSADSLLSKKTKGSVARTVQLVPNNDIIRDDYYKGHREEPEVDLVALKQANLAYAAARNQFDNNEFNMPEENDFNVSLHSQTPQNDFDDFERIEEYNNNLNYQNVGDFEEFDIFETIQTENDQEYFNDSDEEDDGGFGWDDEETSEAINSIPQRETTMPIRRVVQPKPQRETSTQTQNNRNSTQRQASGKISAFDNLFDGTVQAKSMKDFKAEEKRKAQESVAQEKTIPKNTQENSTQIKPVQKRTGIGQGIRQIAAQQQNNNKNINNDDDELKLEDFI